MSWDQSTIIADFSQTFPKTGQPLIASTYHVHKINLLSRLDMLPKERLKTLIKMSINTIEEKNCLKPDIV